MVRSKANVIVKDKALSAKEEGVFDIKQGTLPTKLYTNKFPSQKELSYKQSRYLSSDHQYLNDEYT
jgi:hypothetical protein